MAKKRKSSGTTIYLRDLRAKHVAACIRERMEGYLSGGKVKEKYGYYAWERIRRRLSGKRKKTWQCKGQLLLFLQPFYLKLQIIAKNWNNRECDDFGTRTSLTWSPSKAFCGVSTLAFHQDEDTPGAVLQILGFAEERVGGISSSFVGCQQQPDHSRKRRPCYQFQICPHAHLFSQACG